MKKKKKEELSVKVIITKVAALFYLSSVCLPLPNYSACHFHKKKSPAVGQLNAF
jgi:hypothetical protein